MNGYFQYPDYAWTGPDYGWPSEHTSEYWTGLRFGVPGWRLGDIGSKKHEGDTDWSTVAKVGLVVGGALAVYLIYRASKIAEPIAERAGEAGVKYLASRYGGTGAVAALGSGSRKNGHRALVESRKNGGNETSVLVEPQHYKLLTA